MNIPVYIRRRFGLVATVIACALWACYLDTVEVAGHDGRAPRLQDDSDQG